VEDEQPGEGGGEGGGHQHHRLHRHLHHRHHHALSHGCGLPLPLWVLQRRHSGWSLPEEPEAVVRAVRRSCSSQDDQPRAREEEVSAGEGSEGREAVDGVCESAPDGDEQQCDNCQHVTGGKQLSLKAGGWAELSMTVTVTVTLVGTKILQSN